MRRLTLAAMLAALAMAPICAAQADDAPPSPLNGHFNLVTLDGKEVHDTDYRGKWLLIYFGYTFCPDVCPTTLNEIGTALSELGTSAKKIQPIFITIDPA